MTSLTDVREHPFREGVKSVNDSLALLDDLSIFVPPNESQRYETYLTAARKFLALSSDFIELTYKNKSFYIFKVFKEFMFKYPKSKQNLANPKEITSAFIEFYIRLRKQKVKNFVKEKDDGFKFLASNATNIYNTLVVYTNLLRASSLVIKSNY